MKDQILGRALVAGSTTYDVGAGITEWLARNGASAVVLVAPHLDISELRIGTILHRSDAHSTGEFQHEPLRVYNSIPAIVLQIVLRHLNVDARIQGISF